MFKISFLKDSGVSFIFIKNMRLLMTNTLQEQTEQTCPPKAKLRTTVVSQGLRTAHLASKTYISKDKWKNELIEKAMI